MSLKTARQHPTGKRPIIDGAGHVDPRLVEGLRQRAQTEKDPVAFLDGHPHSDDLLAELMGEGVIEAVTSGDDGLESRDAEGTEETSRSFMETTSEMDVAEAPDNSSTPSASRNPSPAT